MSISKIKEINKFDENRAYAILGDCKRGAISIELGVFNIKDMFTQQILSLIEEREKEKKLSGYGGTLAIEGSAEIYQLGKRFNRLTVEKIIQKKINRAIEELEGKMIGEDEKLIKDKKEMVKIFKLPMRNPMEEADVTFMLLTENSRRKNRNELRDQMRASIKSFLK